MSNIWEIRQVNSSAIALLGYNRQTQTLRIIFNSLSGYDFPNTPEREFLRLAQSPSVGHDFQSLRAENRHQRLSDAVSSAWYRTCVHTLSTVRVTIES